MNYWLVKSEPHKYSWDQFTKDKETFWDGVRNYQARNNLKEMKKGDEVLFYHSNEGLCVVGIAIVKKEFYQDPTTEDTRWVAVNLSPKKAFKRAITLGEIKADPMLSEISLIKQSRLSVMPLKREEFDRIVDLGLGK